MSGKSEKKILQNIMHELILLPPYVILRSIFCIVFPPSETKTEITKKNRDWGFRFLGICLSEWMKMVFWFFLMYSFIFDDCFFKSEVGQKWADSEPSQDKTIILYDILKKPNMVNDMQKIFQVILHILYLSKLESDIS